MVSCQFDGRILIWDIHKQNILKEIEFGLNNLPDGQSQVLTLEPRVIMDLFYSSQDSFTIIFDAGKTMEYNGKIYSDSEDIIEVLERGLPKGYNSAETFIRSLGGEP